MSNDSINISKHDELQKCTEEYNELRGDYTRIRHQYDKAKKELELKELQ